MAGSFAGMSHALAAPRLSKRAAAHGRTAWRKTSPGRTRSLPRMRGWPRSTSGSGRRRRTRRRGPAGRKAARASFTGQARACAILSVLVGYPLGSALIGCAIDQFAGTRGVWVAMLFLGFGVAMWEVWKISKQSPNEGAREELSGGRIRKIDPMHQFQIAPIGRRAGRQPVRLHQQRAVDADRARR